MATVHFTQHWDNVTVFMPLPSMAVMNATPLAEVTVRLAWTPRVGASPFSDLVSVIDEISSPPG